MGKYFGTDGIRGIYGKDITPSLAYKLGCSLSKLCKHKKVLIGRDTRPSGQVLSHSISCGLISHGINVIDVGITPTPVISYLVKILECDYGIVVSASHNPPEYNGIKIFDRFGYKITEKEEEEIESIFSYFKPASFDKVGWYKFNANYLKFYKNKLLKITNKLEGLKIVIDCGNGATFALAKDIFRKICKDVVFINDQNKGLEINENCGALHPETVKNYVLKNNADIGFCFDGDGDRILFCDKNGELFDGDDILAILSCSLPQKNKFVVGTSMTNKGLENFFSQRNITLLRADVGDKYVAEIMKQKNILLGGEPSGHIIVKDYSKTGDAIMVAVLLCSIFAKNKTFDNVLNYKKFPQININIPVQDKFRVLNCEPLKQQILNIQNSFGSDGRVMVRASGTENKIRIMCEHKEENLANFNAKKLAEIIKSLEKMK